MVTQNMLRTSEGKLTRDEPWYLYQKVTHMTPFYNQICDCFRSKQMPLTDQIAKVISYLRITIKYPSIQSLD